MFNMGGSSGMGALIWIIISAVVAVVGGLALHFTFLSKKNEGKFKKFLGWMYDFLTFKKMLIENLLKICYLMLTIFITLGSFAFVSNFLVFLMILVLGNLAIRIVYEFSLVLLLICRNTTEINAKTKSEAKKEAVKVEETK